MAGQNGNKHFIRLSEWEEMMSRDAWRVWCYVNLDHAIAFPKGGDFSVTLIDGNKREDITQDVRDEAAMYIRQRGWG